MYILSHSSYRIFITLYRFFPNFTIGLLFAVTGAIIGGLIIGCMRSTGCRSIVIAVVIGLVAGFFIGFHFF